MKIRPLHNRVVLERHEAESVSKGGIIIPDNAKEKPVRATVLAVGPGKFEHGKLHEPQVKTGDVVLIGKYAGSEVVVEGKKIVVVIEDDILGVVVEA